ncbi:MAG: hypothetical protein IKH28_08055 [Lachnospiraceae bacterium]|nr:hypothetical protein [Lachnospiraceae bacterium]
MKKRLVSILAVVLACVMLVSCSDSSVQTKDGDQKTTESSSEVESGALLPDGEIVRIEVSSSAGDFHFSFSDSETIKTLKEYFDTLELESDFPENPQDLLGMTWILEFLYSDQSTATVYHSGNTIVRNKNGNWYKMKYEQAAKLEDLMGFVFHGTQEQTVTMPWEYPIQPGSEEWKALDITEAVAMLDVPKDVVYSMTTKALFETVMTYPLIDNIYGYDSVHFGITATKNSFFALEAFLEREDALEVLYDDLSACYDSLYKASDEKEKEDVESRINTVTLFYKYIAGKEPNVPRKTLESEQFLLAGANYPKLDKKPKEKDFDANGNGAIEAEEYKAYSQALEEWATKAAKERSVEGYDGTLGEAMLQSFNAKVMQEFLKETNHENRIYSPINVFMALGMLAETSEGNTRKQVLDLLGVEKVEDLRTLVKGLWNSVYKNADMKSVLGASIWLRDDMKYNQATLDELAKEYYASSYAGEMGSQEYTKAFQSWLNDQTDGILEEQVSGLELDPQTVMALATTVCFSARWQNEFRPENTKQDIFHAADGDVLRDFMRSSGTDWYYYGDQFGAIRKWFDGSYGSMIFILPDEGVSVYDLLSDKQVMEYLEKGYDYENKKGVILDIAIPRFDVSSNSDLSEGLKKLGVTDAFDRSKADFSPVSDESDGIWVNKVEHGVRVITDEEGVRAAAYTVEMLAGAARPPEERVEFVLDRPFLFVIQIGNIPMFIGIVENP